MLILFISSTRIGDAVLSTGLLDHLIQENPGARVTVACGSLAAPLFRETPNLERIIVLNKMILSLHWLGLAAAVGLRRWDVLVDLRNSPMFYVLRAKRRWRMGPRPKEPVHIVERLAAIFGLQDNPPSPHLWTGTEQDALAKQLIPDGSPVLAIGPTASWRAKTWRAENFADLTERLTMPDGILPGARVAFFGRSDERPNALSLMENTPTDRRIDLMGRLDLLQVYACLKRCALYVGNDSGLMHLAAASGIPTLGLFGPSSEKLYHPWGSLTETVSTVPPYPDIFPKNFNCRTSDTLMDSLSPEVAEKAARNLWRRVTKAAKERSGICHG